MAKKYHHKLVRDRTPEVIRQNGDLCAHRQSADDDEHMKLVLDKLVEEALELQAAYERSNEVSGSELADVTDVLDHLFAILPKEVAVRYEDDRQAKQSARGLFGDDVILVWTEETNSGQCDVCFKGTQHKDPVTLHWRCPGCAPL